MHGAWAPEKVNFYFTFLEKINFPGKMPLKCSVNAHYTNGFFIFFQSLHLQKRASVASNNDNVYKFINTTKRKSFIRFFVNFEF